MSSNVVDSKRLLPVAGELQRIMTRPTNGVLGMVDETLVLCAERCLRLHWDADTCRFLVPGEEWAEVTGLTPRLGVFRAILARLAVLSQESTGVPAPLYGGEGEIAIPTNPPAVARFEMRNTQAEQRLLLSIASESET